MFKVNAKNFQASQQETYKSFPVTILLTGDPIENFARETLKMLKLYTDFEMGGYNRLYGGDILAHFINELSSARQAINLAISQHKKTLTTTVSVATQIIDNISKYLANPNAAPLKPVFQMSNQERLTEVIKRCLPLLPADVAEQLKALLSPWAIAGIVVVLVAWAAGHLLGASEIADVAILILGGLALGSVVFEAGDELYNFADKTINGTTESDLDVAAQHLAKAIALIGVQTILALLLKKASKGFRENPKPSLRMKDLPKVERPAGEWFYKPSITSVDGLKPGVLGRTTAYGDIEYLSSLKGKLKDETIIHERVHSFLTPKFYPLRNLRVTIAINGYSKSVLLKYLEEAIAETVAQVGTHGLKNAMIGVKFPVKEGYVTLAQMGVEVGGIFLFPVNAAGMTYLAYFNYGNRRR